MKFMKCGLFCLIIAFILAVRTTDASENARRFISAVTAYQNGDFQAAVDDFSTLAGSGLENAELFYNLGNAYFKKGDLGHAVLWYERALKLDPTDPDLKFNLDYALSLTKDQKSESALSLSRIFFFWKYQLSSDAIKWTAIVLNLIFWLFLLVGHLRQKQKLQRTAYGVLLFGVIFTATALYNYYEDTYRPQAVILPPEVSIRSGWTEDATELFVLHAGTKVRIQKEQNDHVRIYFADGKIGWVNKELVGRI